MTPTSRPPSGRYPSSPADSPAVRLGWLLVLRRAPDYPAAHSMDTTWYAVDARGNVGVFETGSAGPVPKKLANHQSQDLLHLLRQLGGGPDLVDEDDEYVDLDGEATYRELADRGVFVYYCFASETEFVDGYVRERAPGRPLHVDQLPPQLRKEFARVPLPVGDFAAAKEIQIVEHVPCVFYWDEAVGYFAPGHKEVWPIPGREAKYRAALLGLRLKYPNVRFADVPGPGRKSPPPRPKKGKKP